jgi:hypothetical protein
MSEKDKSKAASSTQPEAKMSDAELLERQREIIVNLRLEKHELREQAIAALRKATGCAFVECEDLLANAYQGAASPTEERPMENCQHGKMMIEPCEACGREPLDIDGDELVRKRVAGLKERPAESCGLAHSMPQIYQPCCLAKGHQHNHLFMPIEVVLGENAGRRDDAEQEQNKAYASAATVDASRSPSLGRLGAEPSQMHPVEERPAESLEPEPSYFEAELLTIRNAVEAIHDAEPRDMNAQVNFALGKIHEARLRIGKVVMPLEPEPRCTLKHDHLGKERCEPTLEPELPEREAQWADCPRCRQKVLAPHECYESVLNEAGEREAASTIQESWVAFLLEHPTRGGLVERLIFDSGYRAGAASNLEINDNSGWEYDPDAALRRVRAECKAWISVDERLPEFSGTYIVAVNGPGDDGEAYIGTLPADWSITTKHWYDLRGWGHSEVTHWMPIPTAPGSLPSSDWKGRVDEL